MPYPGLAPFVEQDADKLFGRAEEIRAFAHRLHSQALMAVASPSGGGKSSFVAAGVVPALKRSGELWEVITVCPGRHPLGALARALEALDDNGTRTRTVNDSVTAERSLAGRLLVEHRLAGSMVQAWARRAGVNATVTAGALVAVFLISISQIKALRSAASERAAKEEAQRQTKVANDSADAERKAKEEAQKERDARAQAQKKAETYAEALTEKTAALTQALTQSEKLTSALKTKTGELSRALSQTERARSSEQKARVKAQVAVRARDEALRNERARSKDLESQLGGKARLREMEWASGEGER